MEAGPQILDPIASYTALIAAAEGLGDQQTVSTCEQILRDEQDMADWLDEHISQPVTRHADESESKGVLIDAQKTLPVLPLRVRNR